VAVFSPKKKVVAVKVAWCMMRRKCKEKEREPNDM
jgi:hypothetical protein